MWLIESLAQTARWFAALSRRMFRAAPLATSLVIFTTLLSQIFQLLAMLLPLKVVLLMGSDGIPRFFPSMFQEFDREKLVITLSITAVVLYGAYLLMRSASEQAAATGAEILDSKNRKLALFPNQHALTRGTYRSVASAAAGLIFSFAAWLGITVIYPKLGWSLLGVVLFSFGIICAQGARSENFRAWFYESYSGLMENVSALGLFLCLALFVTDYLSGRMPSLLIAIISILLARQLLSRLPSSLTDITKLNRQRMKIDSLFFHGVPFDDRSAKKSENIYQLLLPSARDSWLPALVEEAVDEAPAIESINWYQMGVPNVLALRCSTKSSGRDLLIKLYPPQKQHQADHEITLLSEEGTDRICPPLIHLTHIDNRQCLIFDIDGLKRVNPDSWQDCAEQLLIRTVEIEPSPNLTRRYVRSKNALPQRLRARQRWLSVVAQEHRERRLVEELEERLPAIQDRIERLPHYIRNPDFSRNTLLGAANGSVRSVHWARWSLEPIGADWPPGSAIRLLDALKQHTNKRVLLALDPGDVQTAALLFQFDRFCNQQKFSDAIELIPRILQPSVSDILGTGTI